MAAFRLLLLLLLTSVVSAPLTAAQESVATPVAAASTVVDIAAIDALIEESRAKWNVPGLSVAIVKDGKIVLSKGYGVRELGKPEAVDGETLFAIASNSKAFTAAAILMLQEEGKMKLDDRVQTHLPWMQLYDPWVSAEIRVDDLLCHRSGLGTFSGDLLWWGTPYSPEEVLRRTKHLTPEGPFRSSYGYSNLMFLAAGEVIRSSSGKTWQAFVEERIFAPTGMTRSITSTNQLNDRGNAASPHKPTMDKVTPIPWVNWDTMAAAGGVISCSDDMAKWIRIQLDQGRIEGDKRLFSEASSNRMWTPHTPIAVSEAARKRNPSTHFRSYGLGWMLSDYKGRMVAQHGGGYDGMYSQVMLVPDENLGIVVLTNSMTGISGPLCNTIADRYLGGDATDWLTTGLERDVSGRQAFYDRIQKAITPTIEGTQPSRPLETYTGKFRCPMYGDATVTLEDGKLVLRLLANKELVADLTHLQLDTFVIRWRTDFAWFREGTIQFVPDAQGIFQDLRLDVPNEDLWFHELKLRRVAE